MPIENHPNDDLVTLVLPRNVFVDLELAARKQGLGAAGYIALIHAIHQQHMSADLASCVREILAHDRAILEGLAG
jgi:hypothetical protein